MASEISIIAALIAGFISFLSPCILPVMPGFLAYVSGTSLKNLDNEKKAQRKIFLNSLAFVLGFTTIFAILGVILNSILSHIAYDIQNILAKIGGVIIIFFGLYLLGLFKIKIFEQEHKINVKPHSKYAYINSYIFGAAFAIGWSPCVGAVLGSVFALAATQPGLSFILLLAYSLGLGFPFLLLGLFTKQAMMFIKKSTHFFEYFNNIVAVFLIILGILVFTQQLHYIASIDGFLSLLK